MESESLPDLLGGWSGHLGLLLAEAHLLAHEEASLSLASCFISFYFLNR